MTSPLTTMAMANSLAAIKSAVYAVQSGLLEGISGDDQLQAAAKVLTRTEYADVVTERTIVSLCGYPLCKHPLPESFPRKGRYRISLREHKVYDLQESRLFCSSECVVASQTFAASLPVDRDHMEKTLELAANFRSLCLQDVNNDCKASSAAVDIGDYVCMSAPKQEDLLCHNQTIGLAMADMPTRGHKPELDPPSMPTVQMEEITTTQPQQLTSGTFLLIQEQAEINVGDFCTAGPSNAIEGYVPQREFDYKKVSDHDKDKLAILSSRHKLTEEHSDISRRKERERGGFNKNKQELMSKVQDSETVASCVLETEVSSCTLVDQTKTHLEASDPGSRCSPAFTSSIIIDEKKSTETLGRSFAKKKKKHNRVSWADHNNLELVNESPSSCVSSDNRVSKDPCDARTYEEIDQDNVSSLRNATVVVDERNESLPSQETLCCEAVEENAQVNDFRNDHLDCAQALVAALAEAAEAVAHGEADSSEAVARAGISILPNHEVSQDQLMDYSRSADDMENIDPKDCWFSAPPKDFKPELSSFGTLWMAFDGWISAASIAYVYGRDINDENDFVSINGKEYLRRVIIPNGVSAEIEKTLAGCISRALPRLVQILRFPIPVSTLELSLGRFLRTMSFITALPPFGSKQWQVVALLLLDALSVHHLSTLRTRFSSGRHLIQKVLDSSNITEAEYEVFRDLVLPLGILPEFAAHCGG